MAGLNLAGTQQQTYSIEFEEPAGSNPLLEMMMKVRDSGGGALAGSSFILNLMHGCPSLYLFNKQLTALTFVPGRHYSV